MKKILLSFLIISISLTSIFAQGQEEAASIDGEVGGTLKIWSFTNEINTMAVAYQDAHPEVNVEYTMIPMTNGEYQTKIKAAISSGDVPDVMALEAAFVRDYVETDFLLPLDDLVPQAKAIEVYPFVLQVGSYEGVTKAFSYQATPGAVFYRRSIAKKYLGTDDPVKVQEMMKDMDSFKKVAKTLHDESNGDVYAVCSSGDFNNLFFANRETPWVVDGKLAIDDKVYEMIETAKEFRDNGWEAEATQWGAGWFAFIYCLDPGSKPPFWKITMVTSFHSENRYTWLL